MANAKLREQERLLKEMIEKHDELVHGVRRSFEHFHQHAKSGESLTELLQNIQNNLAPLDEEGSELATKIYLLALEIALTPERGHTRPAVERLRVRYENLYGPPFPRNASARREQPPEPFAIAAPHRQHRTRRPPPPHRRRR